MFQRLAEIYAQRMYPRRLAELVPKGRNPDGIAVRGWPDAYALRSDGRMDVLEATLAEDWRRHLREDIEKLRELDPNKIAGFLFVAWEPVPDFETEQEFHDKLVAAGVPPDTVTLVFAKRLVLDLCQPRFAALWTELLGLPSSPYPLERIQQAEGVFGKEGTAEFAPTLSEYKAGLIHRPELLEEVKQRLRSRGWAWVQGKGATGKTVLGALTALDHEAEEKPAYYLNVESLVEPEYIKSVDLFEILSTRADDGVLFVVDDVHLDTNMASALFKHWAQVGQGSYWLMLGRLRKLAAHSRGVARPLEELRPEALVLEGCDRPRWPWPRRPAMDPGCRDTGSRPPSCPPAACRSAPERRRHRPGRSRAVVPCSTRGRIGGRRRGGEGSCRDLRERSAAARG